jgi:hypothetical protein
MGCRIQYEVSSPVPAVIAFFCSTVGFSRTTFGVTIAGEWSVALNDCGLFVTGVQATSSFTGGCTLWQDSSNWTDGMKAGLMQVALASMDSLRDWFFWTWKVIRHIKIKMWEWRLIS